MNEFLLGCVAMGFAVSGLFFLRYWKQSRDRLFLHFSLAFFLLGSIRLLRVVLRESEEVALLPYLLRLAAFSIILLAIVDKNLRKE